MKEIYLAGGCFWGVEEYMSRIEGVVDTEVDMLMDIRTTPHMKRYVQVRPAMLKPPI